jgi:Na+/proline symporter
MARATFLNAAINVVLLGLLAFIGLALFSWSQVHPGALPEGLGGDRLLPYYVMHALPAGVSGLVIAGIFAAAMSSLDSGINSLTTVLVSDFIRPLRRGAHDAAADAKDLRLAKVATIAFGALATGAAFYAASLEQILKAAQFFLGLFTGPVLAIFLLGILTRRASFRGWLVGLAAALPVSLWVQQATDVHFIYYFPLSFGVCAAVGYVASLVLRDPDSNPAFALGGGGEANPDLQGPRP